MPGWNEGMRLLVALLLAAGSFLTIAQHADAAPPCKTSTTSGASTSRTTGAGAAVFVRLPGEIRWGCLYWRFADHERYLRNCT